MKHTPGPWTAEYVPSLEYWHVFSPEDGIHYTIMFEGSEADCKIIAAAPEMLNELVYVINKMPEVIDRQPFEGITGYMECDREFMENNKEACIWFLENRDFIVSRFKVAINKAKGETK